MDEDWDLDTLKLAFAYYVVFSVVGADGDVHRTELRFINARFPRELLDATGFLTRDGQLSARCQEAAGEALLTLPVDLSEGDKLELIDIFVDASLADGVHDPAEGQRILHAARLLSLDRDVLDLHMKARGLQPPG